MSNKMICPACDSESSSLWDAYANGQPCPYCGLPAAATTEILEARKRGADDALTEKYAEACQRAERAEAHVRQLQGKLQRLRSELSNNDDYHKPDW